ncbi:MAG: phosphoglucosamine mutase [Candidatus Nanopelagicales bacterium]
MGRLFGTDGVRGVANTELTPELALSIGKATAQVLTDHTKDHKPKVVIGRDPRASGEMLEAALISGLTSVGVDVLVAGVVPTPAVAYLVTYYAADAGFVISASHNPMPDNGIKIFDNKGHKLSDKLEDEIEKALIEKFATPTGEAIGRVKHLIDAEEAYIAYLLQTIEPQALKGINLVVDSANGAASEIAPEVYERAGANVFAIHSQADGWNINRDCGSTHIEKISQVVKEGNFDLGISHDGDADRALAVDQDGQVVDGDQILAILALDLKSKDRLLHNTVVSTVMANLGFMKAMSKAKINVATTQVGDRYVLEEMEKNNYQIGGEQSGHIILRKYSSTGDGILTALHLMQSMNKHKKTLSELSAVVTRYPQVLINVPRVDKAKIENPKLQEQIKATEAQLGDGGRVLLRASGTEPVIRVMVEAETDELAKNTCEVLAAVVKETCAL